MKNLILIIGLSLTTLTGIAQKKIIKSFEALSISGGGNVQVFYSPQATLEIKGQETCMQKADIAQTSGNLSIAISGDCKEPLQIFIGTPSLKRLNQMGGGNIEVRKGFGTFDALFCTISGGGNMTILDSIKSLSASVYGGGILSAHVNKLLEGNINGGGSIFYKGTAVVKSNVLGGGKIKKL